VSRPHETKLAFKLHLLISRHAICSIVLRGACLCYMMVCKFIKVYWKWHLPLHIPSSGTLECKHMTLVISMFQNIFPLRTETQGCHLKYPNVLLEMLWFRICSLGEVAYIDEMEFNWQLAGTALWELWASSLGPLQMVCMTPIITNNVLRSNIYPLEHYLCGPWGDITIEGSLFRHKCSPQSLPHVMLKFAKIHLHPTWKPHSNID
jgi:hypothetical protein